MPESYCDELKNAYDEKYYKKNVLGEFDDDDGALVVKNFTDDNIRKIKYNADLPLHISCDFNVNPMCWALAYKDDRKIYVFDEIAMENTTTAGACAEFHARYPNHNGEIIINGDASGDNRSCTSEYTNYVIMCNRFSAMGYRRVKVEIRNFNPPIKNRINAFNAMVCTMAGERRILIDPKCEKILFNINTLKYKEGSSLLDLPTYYQIKQAPSLKFLGHPFDAVSYIAEFYFPIVICESA